MRRKDREILDKDEIFKIISICDVCRLAFFDDKFPYIVPMNFGCERIDDEFFLYFHCAKEGKKLEVLEKNQNVSFEMDCSHRLIEGDTPCRYTMEYESIIGNGFIEIAAGPEKVRALSVIMDNYAKEKTFHIDEKMADMVTILKLCVKNITAKALKVK